MEISQETSLVAKALWSAAIVIGLAALAERASTRVAGLLAGAPLNAVLVFFFVGFDKGTKYVVDSVPHGLAAFTATLAFVLAYHRASLYLKRYVPLGCALVAGIVYLVIALIVVAVPFTLIGATVLTVCVSALAIWTFRQIEFVPVERPVQYTLGLLLMRGSVAAFLIVCVITLAEILGSRWAGVFAGFPSTLLPTLLIIHVTYGLANTHAIIRNFPVGMGSIILYILSVYFSFPVLGVSGGTAISLTVSFSYLLILMVLGKSRNARA